MEASYYLIMALFLVISALIVFWRGKISSWYFLLAGVTAAVLSAVLTFSLTAEEVSGLILTWIDSILSGTPFQPLRPLAAAANGLPGQHNLALTVLLAFYFFAVRPAVFFMCLIIARAVFDYARKAGHSTTNATQDLKRHDYSDAVKAINARVAAISGLAPLALAVAAGCLLIVAGVLSDYGEGWTWKTDKFDLNPLVLIKPLFWIGIYAFLLETLGHILSLEKRIGDGLHEDHPQRLAGPDMRRRPLQEMYEKAVERFSGRTPDGSLILYHNVSSGLRDLGGPGYRAPRTSLSEERLESIPLWRIESIMLNEVHLSQQDARQNAEIFAKFLDQTHNLIFNEPLSPVHIRILFALCEYQQSQGKVSLIICPQQHRDYIDNALLDCASQSLASRIQNPVTLKAAQRLRSGGFAGQGLGLEDNRAYSYILVSDKDVGEELLGPNAAVVGLLHDLGMVVALYAEDLEISALRLQLPRLWMQVERNLSVIVQAGGSLQDHVKLAQALFPSVARSYQMISLQLRALSKTYLIIWDAERKTATRLAADFLKIAPENKRNPGPASLNLAALAASNNEVASFFETDTPVNLSALDRLIKRARDATEAHGIEGRYAHEFVNLQGLRGKIDRRSRFIIVEERNNLLVALAGLYDRFLQGEIWLNVVTHDYPLRDYHLSGLREPGAADAGFQLPPDPMGGIQELLVSLYGAMAAVPQGAPGIARYDIITRFVDQLPLQLRKNFVPGKDGIDRLFKSVGARPGIVLRRSAEDTYYAIDKHDGTPVELETAMEVRQPNKDIPADFVSRSDVGLTVFPNQVIIVDGREHLVREISGNRIFTDGQSVLDGSFPRTLPVLDYRFLNWNDDAALELDTAGKPASWLPEKKEVLGERGFLTHSYGRFARTTIGKINFGEDLPALHPSNLINATPYKAGETIVQEHKYRSVLHMRLATPPLPFDELPKLAFTLGVTFQDVIRSLFPRWDYRLFCVSPQASPIFQQWRKDLGDLNLHQGENEKERLNRFLAFTYPALSGYPPVPVPVPVSGALNSKREEDAAFAAVDLFLIEDSDIDLGIIRAYAARAMWGFEEVFRYLDWLVNKKDGKSAYHSFGTGLDSDLLVYGKALETINLRLRGARGD